MSECANLEKKYLNGNVIQSLAPPTDALTNCEHLPYLLDPHRGLSQHVEP